MDGVNSDNSQVAVNAFRCGSNWFVSATLTLISVIKLNQRINTPDALWKYGPDRCQKLPSWFVPRVSRGPLELEQVYDYSILLRQQFLILADENLILYVHDNETSNLILLRDSVPPKLLGCLQSTDLNENFYYKEYEKVASYLNRKVEEEGDNDESYSCRTFLEILQTDTKMYSHFHGSPVVIVPGITASNLYLRITDTKKFWFDGDLMTSSEFFNNMKLEFNNKTNTTSDLGNVVAGDWGHPEAVKEFEKITFGYLSDKMAGDWGYEAGISLVAAPYDFRRAPNEAEKYFDDLAKLIELTYYRNYHRKVVILAHSMGNLYTLYFLNRRTDEWKDKFIELFFCLAAPWGGSMDAFRGIVSGESKDSDALPFWKRPFAIEKLGQIMRSMPSMYFLLPSKVSWHERDVLFPTINYDDGKPLKNYTVNDYDDIFHDFDLQHLAQIYHVVKDLTVNMVPPNVKVYCAYSTGIETLDQIVATMYRNKPYSYELKYTDKGDGLVLLRSANACLRWKNQQEQLVVDSPLRNPLEHTQMLRDQEFYDLLQSVVFPN